MCLCARNHDLAAAEGVAADEEVHLRGEACQEERLFKRSVTATDHRHLFALEEEAVAGGARADAASA